ncbi:MAG TPA: class I SAM-dependent methyltransferase [Dehalococcoidia bacterium]|nr:class I SAM-dependent methyltransferase [Dehalococcoidia bacterium]
MTSQSLSFDRAASFYDATRALRPDVAGPLADALEREIRAVGDRVLEPGVGTGRIARPVAKRGIRVPGVDISPLMMQQLAAQLTPEHATPDLLLGDATRLPFRDGSFPAVMVCHVLHLIPDWQAAVAEMRRVLAPGGVILHHGEGESDRNRSPMISARIDELLAARGHARRRRPEVDDIRGAFAAVGGSLRTEVVAEWDDDSTFEEHIMEGRARLHSWTWEIPEDIFFDMMDEFEAWARVHVPDDRHVLYEVDVWTFD